MKKRLLILMIVTGMIILLGGLLTYGLGIHEIIPVPRPDLIVVGTSLIGILLIASGACDLFVKKTKEMEIEENDERNISLSMKRAIESSPPVCTSTGGPIPSWGRSCGMRPSPMSRNTCESCCGRNRKAGRSLRPATSRPTSRRCMTA